MGRVTGVGASGTCGSRRSQRRSIDRLDRGHAARRHQHSAGRSRGDSSRHHEERLRRPTYDGCVLATTQKAAAEGAKENRKTGEVFLIVGNSLVYWAFFALLESIAAHDGRPTNAIYG